MQKGNEDSRCNNHENNDNKDDRNNIENLTKDILFVLCTCNVS